MRRQQRTRFACLKSLGFFVGYPAIMMQATASPSCFFLPLMRCSARGLALCLLTFACHALAAEAPEPTPFDHMSTGYVLRGAHERVPCESCHVGGKFRGTPKLCRGCHERQSEIEASKKSPNHIPTVMECDTCHDVNQRSLSWQIVRMNHIGIATPCASCHNGISASGKDPNHIPTAAPCENCHRSTISWAGARMDHTGITTGCIACHNGILAIGKSATHIPIANSVSCELCHKSFASFAGAIMNHNVTPLPPCARCHNGVFAIGPPPPPHPTPAPPCDICHTTNAFLPLKP